MAGAFQSSAFQNTAFQTAAVAPVSTHRARYSGIRLPKKIQPKALEWTPEPITVRAYIAIAENARPDVASACCRIVSVARAALQEAAQDVATGLAALLNFLRAPLREDFGPDACCATGTVRTDEEEALAALYNYMPWLRGLKIKEDT